MTNDVGCYLSSYETVTIWHMRDIVANKRTMVKAKDVKHIIIPQFEGLTIDDLLGYAGQYPAVMRALPMAQKEIRKMPREYIGNIIYTLVGDDFRDWVKSRVDQRNTKVAEEGDMMIDMDPDIYKIFQSSNAVSGTYFCYRSIRPCFYSLLHTDTRFQ